MDKSTNHEEFIDFVYDHGCWWCIYKVKGVLIAEEA